MNKATEDVSLHYDVIFIHSLYGDWDAHFAIGDIAYYTPQKLLMNSSA